jgi:hypothetical protein
MRMSSLRDVVSGICFLLMLFEATGIPVACMSGLLFSNFAKKYFIRDLREIRGSIPFSFFA